VTKILGIDPGLTRCGVGIIELSRGRKLSLVDVRVLASPKDEALDARIGSIGKELEALFKKHRPDVVAIERVFSQQTPQRKLKLR